MHQNTMNNVHKNTTKKVHQNTLYNAHQNTTKGQLLAVKTFTPTYWNWVQRNVCTVYVKNTITNTISNMRNVCTVTEHYKHKHKFRYEWHTINSLAWLSNVGHILMLQFGFVRNGLVWFVHRNQIGKVLYGFLCFISSSSLVIRKRWRKLISGTRRTMKEEWQLKDPW